MRLLYKDTHPMGEEEEDLVFLCVRAEMETVAYKTKVLEKT